MRAWHKKTSCIRTLKLKVIGNELTKITLITVITVITRDLINLPPTFIWLTLNQTRLRCQKNSADADLKTTRVNL